MISDARWRELMIEAGLTALQRQVLWDHLVHCGEDDRINIVNNWARRYRPMNVYEGLIVLIVKERMLA